MTRRLSEAYPQFTIRRDRFESPEGTYREIQDLVHSLGDQRFAMVEEIMAAVGQYIVDPLETDQGAVGRGRTIKAYVDAIGATKVATIKLRHSGAGNTTTYTLTTSETIPSNITLEVEDGAILHFDNGITLTQNGPFIHTGLAKCFTWTDTGKIVFGPSSIKEAYPQYWGAKGDGSTDDSTAIDKMFECFMSMEGFSAFPLAGELAGTAITGPAIFFPLGDYNYAGTGVVWTAGHINLIMRAVPGTVRIRIADGIYLITYTLVDNTFVEGFHFYGGRGAIKYSSTGNNVKARHYIQHNWFQYYTECAVGNMADDMPYFIVRDSGFVGKSGSPTIGVAIGGFVDSGGIYNNTFLRNRYHVKIGDRISGNFYIRDNDLLMWDAGTDRIADIWIVPNKTDAYGVNSGVNLRIGPNKFGNENMQVDDWRILVAAEDTGTGTDRLSHPHSTTWKDDEYVTGVAIADNFFSGIANQTAALIYSYCENLNHWRFHDNFFDGGNPTYIVEFAGNLDGDSETTLWSVRGGIGRNDSGIVQKFSNEPLGIVNDPYLFMGGELATINNYPTIGDDLGYSIKIDADIRTTGTLGDCTKANVADFYGGDYASTLTFTTTGGSWYSAILSALIDKMPGWLEVDLKQSAATPIGQVIIGIFNSTTGKHACRRVINVPTAWRTIRIPFVAPKKASGGWYLRIHGVGYTAGADKVDVGRPKIYQAHQAMNSGHLQIVGSNTGAGDWQGPHMIMGIYHIWVDDTGDLRIKSGAPTSHDDGAIVGTQS